MAETTYDRTKPQKRFTAAVSRGLRESAVLAIGAVALVMLFALLTYHREDAAFMSTGSSGHSVGNSIGPFGAWLMETGATIRAWSVASMWKRARLRTRR